MRAGWGASRPSSKAVVPTQLPHPDAAPSSMAIASLLERRGVVGPPREGEVWSVLRRLGMRTCSFVAAMRFKHPEFAEFA
jgi:hypothetical protein